MNSVPFELESTEEEKSHVPNETMLQAMYEAENDLTLPTAKAEGFLVQRSLR